MGLCPEGLCLRGLSKGVSVQGASLSREHLCPGDISVQGDLCPGGSMSSRVFVQGVSVQGGLCTGGSVQGGLSRGSLSRRSLWGISVQGVSFREIALPPYGNVRMVCIFLECILVRIFFRESMWSVYTLSSYTLESGFCAVSRRLSFYTCLSVHGWGGLQAHTQGEVEGSGLGGSPYPHPEGR